MGLPLPVFYFNQDKLGRLIVIDGRQRLTALFEFMSDKWALKGLKVLDELNGMKFSQLTPAVQSQIEDYQIQAHVIQPPTPDRIMVDIFDRVNRAGTQLNKQEIRNALYQGNATRLLNKIVSTEIFEKATEGAFVKNARMKDRYLILRFLSFELYFDHQLSVRGQLYEYKNDIDELLGIVMEHINALDHKAVDQLYQLALGALNQACLLLEENAFRMLRKDGSRSPINMNVFEVLMHLMAFLPENSLRYKTIINQKINEMKRSPQFQDAIGNHRDSAAKVEARYQMADQILEGLMVEQLQIKELKSIENITLNCKNLNLLTGTNSSGKSTTLQGLLLLMQNLEKLCGLNGPLISIGTFREAHNYNVKNQTINIIAVSGQERIELELQENCNIIGDTESKLAQLLNYKNRRVHYLSCNRIGSQDVYQQNTALYEDIGLNGEYAIDFLCQHKDEPLQESMITYEENYTLLAQVNYWLQYIIGVSIKAEEIIGTDVVRASYGVEEGRFFRPKNVGSGISYLISIIVACLGSMENDIIVIENPEINLHPLSQSRVSELLYFVSQAKRQIFVETHSDHIFNALRVGIAAEKMKKELIGIHFFKLGSDRCTRQYEIEIGKNGRIENPIPNLFDQFQIDLNKMLGL